MGNLFQKLLVLDIDETLIHATVNPLPREADFRVDEYHVYKRPGLDGFLAQCLEWFEVRVWTSASLDYATAVVDRLFGKTADPNFLWARERRTRRFDGERQSIYWIENLKKLRRRGYRREKIIFVDNSAEKLQESYGNLVRVIPYHGGPDDGELPLLMKYLPVLGAVENVRAVEKRDWRSRARAGDFG